MKVIRHPKKSAKMSKMSQNCKKSTKVNSREEKKSTKVNTQEKVPNFETNIPQVLKMEKEASKLNFNRFKTKRIESFRETTSRGALENLYYVQI